MEHGEAASLYRGCERAIAAAAGPQSTRQQAENSARSFIELIRAVLATGGAHLAQDRDGQSVPKEPDQAGWRRNAPNPFCNAAGGHLVKQFKASHHQRRQQQAGGDQR